MSEIQKDKNAEANPQNHQDGGSSQLTKPNMRPKNKRSVDFNEFKWVLTSLAMIAGFYNSLGQHAECEKVYVKYMTYIEDFYQKDSLESGNAYFMMGVYYLEQNQHQKSLACFLKALYIRKKDLGPYSLGAADCHYNMAILYKKLNALDRTLLHFNIALKIRK